MVIIGVLVLVNNKSRVTLPVVVKPVPTVTPVTSLKFGVMADIHLDWEEWAKFLKIAKDRGEQMVIVAGDLTSVGKLEELVAAKKVLDESGMKYYVIPGNHDLWTGDRQQKQLFNQVFGSDYQSFKMSGHKFILINNGGVNGLGEIQYQWLEREVVECRVVNCVVVMHIPLNHSFSGHVMGEGNPQVAAEGQQIITWLVENRVAEIITGHLHYATSYELDGFRTNIVGAISRSRNNQTPRYTELVIENGLLNRQVVEADHDLGN